MFIYLNNITADAEQESTIVTPDGYQFFFALHYQEQQMVWLFDLVYSDAPPRYNQLLSSGQDITSNLKSILPFGILCLTNDGYDPYFIDDFSTERVRLYVGSRNEVEELMNTIKI